MNDLIGIPQTAKILNLTRQRIWQMYKDGQLQAVTMTGTDERPRPLFSRQYIERLAKEQQASVAVA
jgi:hypothetical protein